VCEEFVLGSYEFADSHVPRNVRFNFYLGAFDLGFCWCWHAHQHVKKGWKCDLPTTFSMYYCGHTYTTYLFFGLIFIVLFN